MPAVTVVLRKIPRLSLHLSDMVEDVQNTGIMVARRRPEEIVLNEGRNEIDEGFWREWLRQNTKTGLVQRSFVIGSGAETERTS